MKDVQEKGGKSLFYVALFVMAAVGVAVITIMASSLVDDENSADATINNTEALEPGTEKLTGLVTETFKDCGENLVLVDGEVQLGDIASCDGGSYIVIDDNRSVYYESGYVPADQSFYADIGTTSPGDTVEVIYAVDEYDIARVNCDTCYVKVLEEGPEYTP